MSIQGYCLSEKNKNFSLLQLKQAKVINLLMSILYGHKGEYFHVKQLACTVLYCIVLYCIVLYCIVLYCIVLYCIALY